MFILPPDRATVEERLRARSTDDEETIQRRLADMDAQIAGIGSYDYLLVNDDLATAKATLQGIVAAELSRRPRRESLIRTWLGTEVL